MAVEISRKLVTQLTLWAGQALPQEACGLLFGEASRIADARLAKNVAADPLTRFEIDPAALFAALRAERAGDARLIGYWHSHPSGQAGPSATDRAMARSDGKYWLILAGEEVTLWQAEPSGMEPVNLTIMP